MRKIRRFLVEREVLVGLVIFGVLVMFADFCSDMDWHFTAAVLRILGILALFTLLGLDLWFRFRHRPIDVPLMFTECVLKLLMPLFQPVVDDEISERRIRSAKIQRARAPAVPKIL